MEAILQSEGSGNLHQSEGSGTAGSVSVERRRCLVRGEKDKIREELADLLNYYILMADTCGLDMDEIIQKKSGEMHRSIRWKKHTDIRKSIL